jgi:hypothetical protein
MAAHVGETNLVVWALVNAVAIAGFVPVSIGFRYKYCGEYGLVSIPLEPPGT